MRNSPYTSWVPITTSRELLIKGHEYLSVYVITTCQNKSWLPVSMSRARVSMSWVNLSTCHEYLHYVMSTPQHMSWVLVIIRHEYLSVHVIRTSNYVIITCRYLMCTCKYMPWVPLSICHEYLSVYVMSTSLYVMSTSQYIPWVALHVRIWHEYLSVYVMSTCLCVLSTCMYHG